MSDSNSLPPIPRDPRQPEDFDPAGLGRKLLRSARIGTLATQETEGGFPFATLVNVATDLDGTPVILVSQLSSHTRNLMGDGRVSLLLTKSGQNARAEKGDPMAHPRLTVQARAARVEDTSTQTRVRRRFLARHPKAQIYAVFADSGCEYEYVYAAHACGESADVFFNSVYEFVLCKLCACVAFFCGFFNVAEVA